MSDFGPEGRDTPMQNQTKQTAESLVEMLRGDSVTRRHEARDKLIALGRKAVPVLVKALGDENSELRWEAAMTLKRLPYPEVAPALVGALEDENGDVRWVAAEAIMTQPPEGLRVVLKALIEQPEAAWLREGAHFALSNLTDRSLREQMAPLAKVLGEFEGTQEEVMFQAEKILEKLQG
jgi:HEAT repeat protein